MEDIKFKIHGMDRLVSITELQRLPTRYKVMPILVVDLKVRKSYKSMYGDIIRKFG